MSAWRRGTACRRWTVTGSTTKGMEGQYRRAWKGGRLHLDEPLELRPLALLALARAVRLAGEASGRRRGSAMGMQGRGRAKGVKSKGRERAKGVEEQRAWKSKGRG